MNKVVIVGNDDNEIGVKRYDELRYEDIYRVSALWLVDEKTGDCLLTQRKWSKHNDPGKWMAAASGTIEEGESYDENIVHEVEEEIGITGLKLSKGPKDFVDDGKHQFFVQWYSAKVDKDNIAITIQEEEIESYAWVPINKLLQDVTNSPQNFVPSMLRSLKVLGVTV